MILYLDSSAIVKRYVREFGADETREAIDHSRLVGTCVIARAEVSAAFARAERMSSISVETALACHARFDRDWPSFVRLELGEDTVERAAALARSQALRGFDALHLAAALDWQASIHESVLFATFDRQLWQAAERVGLELFPDAL